MNYTMAEMENLDDFRIWEIRHQIAIERFGDYCKEMEIPGYSDSENELLIESVEEAELKIYRENLEKRWNACKLRYAGMEDHMEIPDMDLWLKLKNEIFDKTRPKPLQRYRGCYHNGEEMEYPPLRLEDSLLDDNDSSSDKEEFDSSIIDKEEFRYLCFKDEWTSGGRRRRGDSF